MNLGPEVTDPAILAQLNGSLPNKFGPEVTDPAILAQLNGTPEPPGMIKSGALGLMSGIPGAETAISGIESAVTPKTYEEVHGELENAKNAAWEGHPVAYGAGKAAGMVGTAVAAPELEMGAIPGAIATGAGIGALSGLDVAAKPSEMLPEALKGTAAGAVTGGAVGAVGEGLSKALPAVGKGIVAGVGKPTLSDVEAYLKNPEAIRSALTSPQLAEKLAQATGQVGEMAGEASAHARNALRPDMVSLDMDSLKGVFRETADKYLTNGLPTTSSDEIALKTLSDQFDKLGAIAQQNDGKIPETTLRDMVDKLQDATKANTWGNPEASASQGALRDLSGKLNEALRTGNAAYTENMAPAKELSELSGNLQEKFGLERNESGEVVPTEATNRKLPTVLDETKTESQDYLGQLKEKTGVDLLEAAKNSQIKGRFDEPNVGGALKIGGATVGYGLGRLSELPFGGIFGAAAGRAASTAFNGGQVAKGILDLYLNISNRMSTSSLAPIVNKFGPILVNAAKVGGNQLAATHFVLATSNPEYQQLVDHVQGGQ